MSLKTLEAFDGLSVITSEMDEIEVGHLLKATEDLSLVCQDCDGKRFTVQGYVPVAAEIISGKHVVVAHVEYEKLIVNRVVKCTHCGSTDFVTITKHN
jgi:DNA-directed RNA polymerase subunit RPC12/RpoP